jgi:predicted nucleotidyltransferase
LTPTPYSDLNAVLHELVTSMQATLGGSFVSACLQGSFAVGDFDRDSDVDFIVAVEEEMTPEQVQALNVMHERVYNLECPWAQHLEGSYFPKDILRYYSQLGKSLWYLEHGDRSLIRSDHCNSVVVRWTVREHGVLLAGGDPSSLIDPIPVEALRQEILSTMRDWGQKILNDPEPFRNRFYQSFIVLSYCRMLHDLRNGHAGSKRAGTEWAKGVLDPSWAGLIDRAWDGRPNPSVSVRQPADAEDFRLALEFIQYVTGAAIAYASGQ